MRDERRRGVRDAPIRSRSVERGPFPARGAPSRPSRTPRGPPRAPTRTQRRRAGQPAKILAGPRRAQAVPRPDGFIDALVDSGAHKYCEFKRWADVDAVGRARAPVPASRAGGVQGPNLARGEAIADRLLKRVVAAVAAGVDGRSSAAGIATTNVAIGAPGSEWGVGERVRSGTRESAPGDGRRDGGATTARARTRASAAMPLRSPPPLPAPRRGSPVRARAQRRRISARGCGVSRAGQVRRVVGRFGPGVGAA